MAAIAAATAPPRIADVIRKAAKRAAVRAYATAKAGAASALGTAGMASVAFGAGLVYLPAGFVVGGALAIWLASLLPAGDR